MRLNFVLKIIIILESTIDKIGRVYTILTSHPQFPSIMPKNVTSISTIVAENLEFVLTNPIV